MYVCEHQSLKGQHKICTLQQKTEPSDRSECFQVHFHVSPLTPSPHRMEKKSGTTRSFLAQSKTEFMAMGFSAVCYIPAAGESKVLCMLRFKMSWDTQTFSSFPFLWSVRFLCAHIWSQVCCRNSPPERERREDIIKWNLNRERWQQDVNNTNCHPLSVDLKGLIKAWTRAQAGPNGPLLLNSLIRFYFPLLPPWLEAQKQFKSQEIFV